MKNNLYLILLFIIAFIVSHIQQLDAQVAMIDTVFPQKGPVGSLIKIKGSKLSNPLAVKIGDKNGIIVSSSDTMAVAMVMPGTTGGAISVINSAGPSIYAIDFLVTKSAPPNKQFGDKLYGRNTENTVNASEQGFSVAISADGNTVVVGGDFDSNDTGAVRVFIRTNNVWTQQGDKLIGTGTTGSTKSAQGYSVAISADGNTFIEGGVGDNGFIGAAWIFTRDKNGTWAQQGNKLVGTGFITVGTATPEQGFSVGMSADGNTAIVGAPRDSNYIGAAWIYTRTNGVWTERAKLIGSNHISIAYHQGYPTYLGVDQGTSVALSADGNTALVGGPRDNNDTGAVWIFVRANKNTWVQQGNKLVGTGSIRSFNGGIKQGTSVAASADGNTIIEGGPFDTDGLTDYNYGGAAWIFTRAGNTWSQQGNKLFATDATSGAEQGWSVSISADGNTAIVGGPTDSFYTGAAWIYTRTGNAWLQHGHKLVGTGAVGAAKQGWSSCISADGNTAIIGGPEDYYQEQGAAWVFTDSTGGLLPVTLVDFKAYILGKGIETSWTGFNEINMRSYGVERSIDGHRFSSIGNLPAKQNAALQNSYSWFDAAPFEGDNFYRIRAVNKDATFQYSGVIKIKLYTSEGLMIYPNPSVNKSVHVQLNHLDADDYTLTMYNSSGIRVYQRIIKYTAGLESITVHPGNVANGVYEIELKGIKNTFRKTVMLQ